MQLINARVRGFHLDENISTPTCTFSSIEYGPEKIIYAPKIIILSSVLHTVGELKKYRAVVS